MCDEIPEGFTEDDRCPGCHKFKFGPTLCEVCVETRATSPLREQIERQREEIDRLRQENKEYGISFDLYDEAARRAIERWREESPEERELVMPDHSKLCQWLMAKLRQTEKERDDEMDLVEEIKKALERAVRTEEAQFDDVWDVVAILKKHGVIE